MRPLSTFLRPPSTALAPLAVLLVLPIAVGPAPAQEEPALPPEGFSRVTVELALVQATVRDDKGNYVRGLTVRDFRLLENGQQREIVLFSEEPEAPVRIAFLLDVSGSMSLQQHLLMARGGVRFFLDRLGPHDEAAVFAFADGAVEVLSDFTTDRRQLSDALLSLDAYGQTALMDAVARAPQLVPRKGNTRRAIILFSDGVDNISRLSQAQAVDLARRTEVPVYALGFLDEVERRRADLGSDALERFSRETGGAAYMADDYYEVHRATREVLEELKQAYILGYYPSPSRDSHSLELQVSCRGCVVTSRRGLYAEKAGTSP